MSSPLRTGLVLAEDRGPGSGSLASSLAGRRQIPLRQFTEAA